MLWLQSGTNVGVVFQQHQTTVSRNQKKCAQILGITLSKSKNKWVTQGDLMLLQLERKVHQFARLQGKVRLRMRSMGGLKVLILIQLQQDGLQVHRVISAIHMAFNA